MSEVAVTIPSLTSNEEVLAGIQSYEDAIALIVEATGGELLSTEDFGDGFSVVDKETLVKQEFVILGIKFSTGDYGDKSFAIIHAVTHDGRKVIITDGSSGIRDQAAKYAARGIYQIKVPNGLVKSDYDFCNFDPKKNKGCNTALKQGKCECGDKPGGIVTKATTYYLS